MWSHWENFCSGACSHFSLKCLDILSQSWAFLTRIKVIKKLIKVMNIFRLSGQALIFKRQFLIAEWGQQWLWAVLCCEPFFLICVFLVVLDWQKSALSFKMGAPSCELDTDVMHVTHPSCGRTKVFSRDCSALVFSANLWASGSVTEWNRLEAVEQPWIKISVKKWRIRHTVSESWRPVLAQTEDDGLEQVPWRYYVILGKRRSQSQALYFLNGFH